MRCLIISTGLIAIFAFGADGHEPGGPPTSSVALTSWGVGEIASSQGGHGPEVPGEEMVGPVYMYGRLLKKPYGFSNAGGDTLYLNGVPYWPIRGPLPPAERYPELAKRFAEKAKAEFAQRDSLSRAVRALHDAGAGYQECLDSLAAMYGRSPLAMRGSVRKLSNGIVLKWADGTAGDIGLGFEHAPPYNRVAHHQQMMRDFWRTVKAGGMIARGYVDGLSYFLTTPKSQLEKTNRLLARLAAGDTLTREDVINTPLTNKGFRIQMGGRQKAPGHREE